MPRALAVVVSLVILGLIYLRVDLARVGGALGSAHVGWLALALALIVPTTAISAWRFSRMTLGAAGFIEALRLVLAAAVLNLILPSKLGDLAKAHAVSRRGALAPERAWALVVLEKGWDLLALLLWCSVGLGVIEAARLFRATFGAIVAALLAIGLAFAASPRTARPAFALLERLAPPRLRERLLSLEASWADVLSTFWSRRGGGAWIAAVSVLLWYVHLVQIWLFTVALGARVPLVDSLALAPLAILAGLLPIGFAGAGTRDAALILLYAPFMDPAAGAALGVLCTLRYVVPALLGLPFFGAELRRARGAREPASDGGSNAG